MACEQGCPVDDDYAALQRSPDRQVDLPRHVDPERASDAVHVRWVGPSVVYRPDYDE
jgi:hypothetical protein